MYLTQGLHRAAQQQGGKAALRFEGRQQTYAELLPRIARLAGALRGLGVCPGDRVSILAHNSDRIVELLFAAWWCGAVANPLNTRWSVAEVACALDDSEPRVLVVDDALAPIAGALRAAAASAFVVVHAGTQPAPDGMPTLERLLADADPVDDLRRGGDALAAILYTGGTTGFPKGVMLSHANLWSATMTRMAELNNPADGVSLLATPLFHAAGLGRLVSLSVVGASIVIHAAFRAEAVLQCIQDEGVSDVVLVPSMLQMVLDHPGFGGFRLQGLRRIVYGAAPITPALLDRALQAFPGVEFVNTYGMTETASVVCIGGPDNHGPEARASGRVRSVGRAGYGSEIRIVDGAGRDVPRGTVGELVVRGPTVMLGYWKKPEETAAVLRNGWLHTGDGAWMDEAGYVSIADRLKDMIISGGENVYPAEVEAALMQHPSVAACAVVGVPSQAWGEAVHAVVVPRPGRHVDEAALRAHCRTLLAGYKCPKTVELRDALPLSAAGKVLKNTLRESVDKETQA